jgi:sec-independent protein translocase protein TatA
MGGTEWLIVAAVVLVLFGGSQLPKLARGLGEAQKEFKRGSEEATRAPAPAAAEKASAARDVAYHEAQADAARAENVAKEAAQRAE